MKRKQRRWLDSVWKNKLNVVTVVLFALAAYFAFEVEASRRKLEESGAQRLVDGESVRITRIIDGDEVMVRNAAGKEGVVRMLGIQGFRVTVASSMQSFYGKRCTTYLEKHVLNREATLTLGKSSSDKRGRTLGYLSLPIEHSEKSVDLGRHLVSEGLVVVYTKYNFERMSDYLQTEQAAMSRKAGLWQEDEMRIGVIALKEAWATQREDD